MKLSISKSVLTDLLYLTNSIVEKKNTMPILANVKLTAENGKLGVAATDLEVSLVSEVDCEIEKPGSITVDAKVIYDIVKELPGSDVSLRLSQNQRLEIESGTSRFKINGIATEEYPTIAGVSISKPATVSASKLYKMLEKTAFAVSNDETRYNINGVFAESNNGNIRLVATDGHRLAMIDRAAEGFDLSESVIIPKKGISELKKVLENNDGEVKVSIDSGFFTIESLGVILGVRLVDGQFPDYKQVIPKESSTEIKANRSELLSAVKRVSLVTTDKTKALKCNVSGSTLLLSSSSPEYGEALESVDIEQKGGDVTVGFSAKYLLDVLSAMSQSEEVSVKLKGELGPGLFSGNSDKDFDCIVMPMRFE